MSNLSAKLIQLDLIEVCINNSFYKGITSTLTLKQGKDLFPLDIIKTKKNKQETIYHCALPIEINFSKEYEVLDDHCLKTTLKIDSVVRTPEFDEMFFYDGFLGNRYTVEKTEFFVWSPISTSVKVEISLQGETKTYEMKRLEKGCWYVEISGDLDSASYVYLLKVNGEYKEATDPYAYSSTPNHKRSVVVDLKKTYVPLYKEKLVDIKSFTDAIIYECHVRDISSNPNSHILNRGKFLGLVEENTLSDNHQPTGFDYLKSIGMTHLQIQPFYDFGSVDEENQFAYYNWGYDPVQYNVPEGSYITDVSDPYKRIIELKQMISKLHEVNIRVNMDVVYNHMFDLTTSAFHHIMPGYYFRYGKKGEVSNGSFCGNDIESSRKMVRRYIVDSCLRWVLFYGVDGFRFDLMGIVDVDTMNLLREKLNEVDPSIMLYGEGWHMPTLLDDDLRGSMRNQGKLGNIGHFNDRYRDLLKGPHHNLKEIGFVGGNLNKTKGAMHVLLGSTIEMGHYEVYFNRPDISINYSACHDNYTLFDQLKLTNPYEYETIKDMHRLLSALVFVSQGVAFIHGGQEFLITKQGVENSYMSKDDINWFDYNRKDENIDTVNYIKGMIMIRKAFKGFRLDTVKDIEKYVTMTEVGPGLIDYQIKYNGEEYRVLINVTKDNYVFNVGKAYDVIANKDQAGLESLGIVKELVMVEPTSLMILKR